MSRLACALIAFATLVGCPGPDSDNGTTSSASSGCSDGGEPIPEGGYACVGSGLVRCSSGTWVNVVSCSSLQWTSGSGFHYTCRCAGGSGMDTTSCTYGGSTCGGQSYRTCGPNYHPVITDLWRCVPN
jgi:hypothetical protein